ncbi:MAG: tRNA pseudouridine13 synthase [Candidatus Azotimanducaceae bacterium]
MTSDRSLTFQQTRTKSNFWADLKSKPSDFKVVENLGFEPSGGGEHIYLKVRKTSANTAWVATQIAEFAGVRAFDVNYSGRKDRHAITEQWLSCWKPGKDMPEFEAFFRDLEGVELLDIQRYNKKLRKGTHESNSFVILLRNIRSSSTSTTLIPTTIEADVLEELELRLRSLASTGFANYFGEQRFGNDGQNLVMADKLFNGEKVPKNQRDMYLSAARSYMFNWMLGTKIESGEYLRELDASLNVPENQQLQPVGRDGIVSNAPRGWLYGQSRVETAREIMEKYEAIFPAWTMGLKKMGMKAQLRNLRILPCDLKWHFDDADLQLSFTLPTGSFATELIKELVNYGE